MAEALDSPLRGGGGGLCAPVLAMSQVHEQLDVIDPHLPLLVRRAPLERRLQQLPLLLLQEVHALLDAVADHVPAQRSPDTVSHSDKAQDERFCVSPRGFLIGSLLGETLDTCTR